MGNWCPSPITCNETQHKKAPPHVKDEVSALKIMRPKNPTNAFKIGQKVKCLRSKVWNTKRYDVMQSLIRMKLRSELKK